MAKKKDNDKPEIKAIKKSGYKSGRPLKGKELEEHLKAFTDIEDAINDLFGYTSIRNKF